MEKAVVCRSRNEDLGGVKKAFRVMMMMMSRRRPCGEDEATAIRSQSRRSDLRNAKLHL